MANSFFIPSNDDGDDDASPTSYVCLFCGVHVIGTQELHKNRILYVNSEFCPTFDDIELITLGSTFRLNRQVFSKLISRQNVCPKLLLLFSPSTPSLPPAEDISWKRERGRGGREMVQPAPYSSALHLTL